ncbi:MAG: hypothetical protein AAF442_09750 [Pseudomonadota bacterium]
MKSPIRLPRLALSMVLVGLWGAPVTAQEVLVLALGFPPDHLVTAHVHTWSQEVRAATDGRVEVLIPAHDFIKPTGRWAAVQAQVVDAAVVDMREKDTLAFSIAPLIVADVTAGARALWNVYQEAITPSAGEPDPWKGLEVLSLFYHSPGHLFTTGDAVPDSVESLAASPMWVAPEAERLWDSLAADGPGLDWADVTRGLQSGQILGLVGASASAVREAGAGRDADYRIVFDRYLTVSGAALVINAQSWERLSKEDREAIKAISGVSLSQAIATASAQEDRDALDQLERAGMVQVTADPVFAETLAQTLGQGTLLTRLRRQIAREADAGVAAEVAPVLPESQGEIQDEPSDELPEENEDQS